MSSNPLAAADLTLPAPGDNGSLSNHADIVIDSAYQVRNDYHGIVDTTIRVRCYGVLPVLAADTASTYILAVFRRSVLRMNAADIGCRLAITPVVVLLCCEYSQ